jgi:hypothetical protein
MMRAISMPKSPSYIQASRVMTAQQANAQQANAQQADALTPTTNTQRQGSLENGLSEMLVNQAIQVGSAIRHELYQEHPFYKRMQARLPEWTTQFFGEKDSHIVGLQKTLGSLKTQIEGKQANEVVELENPYLKKLKLPNGDLNNTTLIRANLQDANLKGVKAESIESSAKGGCFW